MNTERSKFVKLLLFNHWKVEVNEKEAGPGEQVDTLPISLPNYNMQQISFDASTISLLQLRNSVHKTAVLPKGTLFNSLLNSSGV